MREVAYAKLSDRIGRHERMNLTVKKKATRPRSFNNLQRRIASTPWLVSSTQNHRMRRSTRSIPPNSTRRHDGLDRTSLSVPRSRRVVTACDRLRRHAKKINLLTLLTEPRLGITENNGHCTPASCTLIADTLTWSTDLEPRTLQPSTSRSREAVTHVRAQPVTYVSGGTVGRWRRGRDSNPR